jgi:hypothetical protein
MSFPTILNAKLSPAAGALVAANRESAAAEANEAWAADSMLGVKAAIQLKDDIGRLLPLFPADTPPEFFAEVAALPTLRERARAVLKALAPVDSFSGQEKFLIGMLYANL